MSDALETSGYTPGPRAFYVCAKCHDAGKMAEPVELPTSAKHCPVCGRKKYLERIWSGANAVARVSTGPMNQMAYRRLNEQLGPAGYDEQKTAKMNAWRNRQNGIQLTSIGNLGQAVARATGGAVPAPYLGDPHVPAHSTGRQAVSLGDIPTRAIELRPAPGSLNDGSRLPGQ